MNWLRRWLLAPIHEEFDYLEKRMNDVDTAVARLQASEDANTTSLNATLTGISTEIKDLAAAVANGNVNNPDLAAALNAIADKVDANKVAEDSATAALAASDATVNPPASAPAPSPAPAASGDASGSGTSSGSTGGSDASGSASAS